MTYVSVETLPIIKKTKFGALGENAEIIGNAIKVLEKSYDMVPVSYINELSQAIKHLRKALKNNDKVALANALDILTRWISDFSIPFEFRTRLYGLVSSLEKVLNGESRNYTKRGAKKVQ